MFGDLWVESEAADDECEEVGGHGRGRQEVVSHPRPSRQTVRLPERHVRQRFELCRPQHGMDCHGCKTRQQGEGLTCLVGDGDSEVSFHVRFIKTREDASSCNRLKLRCDHVPAREQTWNKSHWLVTKLSCHKRRWIMKHEGSWLRIMIAK